MNKTRNITLSSLSLLLSTAAYAQFAPGIQDLNSIFEPPANIDLELCANYKGETDKLGEQGVCKDGVAAARWMAEKYATGAGTYLGCVDGFRQGFGPAFDKGRNPTPQMINDANATYANVEPQSAVTRGQARAVDQGQTASADQIIKRYRAVIGQHNANGQQVLPDKTYDYPNITFNGFTDGYATDVLPTLGGFSEVRRLGWVTDKSSFEDQLSAQKIYQLQQGNNPCPAPGETIFGRRGVAVMSLWDIYRAQDQIDFEAYGWRNPDWAWEVYDKYERNMDQWVAYSNIANRKKVVTVVTAIKEKRPLFNADGTQKVELNADGTVKKDANGHVIPMFEEVITGYTQKEEEQNLTPAEVQNLQGIYRQFFGVAYDRYYARKYASLNYNREGIAKMKIGQTLGEQASQSIAIELAKEMAYDRQYQTVSAFRFGEKIREIYKTSFDRLIGIFANNPVLQLDDAKVYGNFDDGIFRPGERLGLIFSATNLGEVASRASMINFTAGQIQVTSAGFLITTPALSREVNRDAGLLATVPDSLSARTTLNLGMALGNIGNLQEIAKNLNVSKNQSITLHDYAEINDVESELDYVNGNVKLYVDVTNPSTLDPGALNPPMVFKVTTDFGALGQDEKDAIQVGPKSSQRVVLELGHIDPLVLIQQRSINGTVNAVLGGKTIHSDNINVAMSDNQEAALLNYFDALATGRSNNSGNQTKQNRLAALETSLANLAMGDVEQVNVLWKRDTGKRAYDETTVHTLVQKYQESKRANRLTPDAQVAYDNLAIAVAKASMGKIRAGGGLRFSKKKNRVNFLKRLQAMSPNMSLNPSEYI